MTGYLLDENVLREIGRLGNSNVLAWHKEIPQVELHLSVITIFEKRRGWERVRHKGQTFATTKLAELDALALAFGSRLLSIDAPVAAEGRAS